MAKDCDVEAESLVTLLSDRFFVISDLLSTDHYLIIRRDAEYAGSVVARFENFEYAHYCAKRLAELDQTAPAHGETPTDLAPLLDAFRHAPKGQATKERYALVRFIGGIESRADEAEVERDDAIRSHNEDFSSLARQFIAAESRVRELEAEAVQRREEFLALHKQHDDLRLYLVEMADTADVTTEAAIKRVARVRELTGEVERLRDALYGVSTIHDHMPMHEARQFVHEAQEAYRASRVAPTPTEPSDAR